jgi:hypothetical protein
MMKKMIIGSMCLIALMAASIAMALAQDSQNVNGSMTGNTISNIAEPTLQVGSAIATRPVNNRLSLYSISASGVGFLQKLSTPRGSTSPCTV